MTKVLYLTGFGRSGSTILGNILDQIPGIVHVGEVRNILDSVILGNRHCGCGRFLSECPFWLPILEEVGLIDDEDYVQSLLQVREQGARSIHGLLVHLRPWQWQYRRRLQPYVEWLERLYGGIAAHSNAQVIVDSSKYPAYGYWLAQLPSMEVITLHLFRDPRAVAYSWQRRRRHLESAGQSVPRYSVLGSTLRWIVHNLSAELLHRGKGHRNLRVKYEELATRPKPVLREIMDTLAIDGFEVPVDDDNRVRVSTTHTVWGNPVRSRTGVVSIRLDNEWKDRMDKKQMVAVSIMTWPLLRKYRYA